MGESQGISLDHGHARERLQAAIALAESDGPVPEEWEERSKVAGNLRAKTYTPFLGTVLLARATDGRVDALAIKKESGPGGYSARGLCHQVLVPASREHRFSIRTTGPEPLNNQPFFRYDRVDQIERVKYRDLKERLVPILNNANELSPDEALMALASFLRVCFRRARSTSNVSLKDVGLSLRATFAAAGALVSEDAEGGKRAQALTAAAFDVIYGPKSVRTGKVNDPSVHFPGDVHAMDQSGRPVIAAEVRAKPVPETEIEGFALNLAEAGIARGVIVALARAQPDLPYSDIEQRVSHDPGVLLTVIDSVDALLKTAFAWSPRSLPEVLAGFPERVNERLREIEVEPATVQRWRELVQPAKEAVTEP